MSALWENILVRSHILKLSLFSLAIQIVKTRPQSSYVFHQLNHLANFENEFKDMKWLQKKKKNTMSTCVWICTWEGDELTSESYIKHLEDYNQDLLSMATPYLHRNKQPSTTEESEQTLSLLDDIKRLGWETGLFTALLKYDLFVHSWH